MFSIEVVQIIYTVVLLINVVLLSTCLGRVSDMVGLP